MATKLKVNKIGYVLAYDECKGSVQCKTDLPTDATKGDVYNVLDEDGTYYHFDGSEWCCCACDLEIEGSGGSGSVDVDSELSETSTNPVENKVVTASINEINDALGDALYKANQGETVELEGDIIEYALKSDVDTLNSNSVTKYSDVSFLVKEGNNRYLYCLNGVILDITDKNQYNVIGGFNSTINIDRPYYAPAVFGYSAELIGIIRVNTDGTLEVFLNEFTGETPCWCQLRFYTV